MAKNYMINTHSLHWQPTNYDLRKTNVNRKSKRRCQIESETGTSAAVAHRGLCSAKRRKKATQMHTHKNTNK